MSGATAQDPLQGPAQGSVHGSAVAVDGRGLLIVGGTGTGKSALALAMIGLGAKLVSDDQTMLSLSKGDVILTCPNPALHGVIEARGVGLIRAEATPAAPLTLVVDLDLQETERLPARRSVTVLGCVIDLVYGTQSPTFPVALMLQLRHGRHA